MHGPTYSIDRGVWFVSQHVRSAPGSWGTMQGMVMRTLRYTLDNRWGEGCLLLWSNRFALVSFPFS